MIQTIANRAWAGLSLQKQQDIVEQAREEELCCPSQTGPDPAQDVPISQIQVARRNSSSNDADASPEPTVEDNAGVAARRPGDDDIEAGGIAESMVVDGSGNSEESGNPASVGVSATGTANSGGSTEENLDVLLVEAEAQHKVAEEALKGLRDTLKREKRKDEKAMADAEKKRNKMKEAMRHLEQRVQMREHFRSHRMPTDAPPERKKAMRMEDNMRPAISTGEYVLVSADFSPNMNRPEGKGFVMVSRGVGGGTLCDVQCEKPFGGMMHKNVPLKAITPIPLGLNTDSIAKDRRKRTAIYRMERSEFSSCITMRNGSGVSSSELLRRLARKSA